jgi:mannose-6-phosphate isomerase-like protein (cupin superfamily)
MAVIMNLKDLPDGSDFEGYLYGDVASTFIWEQMKPGTGPKLHKHPYAEIFIVLEGEALYTVGDETIEAEGGQVLIAPPHAPHKFVNSGTGILRQVDIHCNDRFITEWLED